jgi:rhodanese-related sulfurtransferase
MKTLCRVSLTPDLCVSQTHALFERWGVNALPIAKFIPGLAVIAPPLAGAAGVGSIRFLLYSTLGASLWVGAGMGMGLVLKDQIGDLLALLERTGSVAFTLLAALCLAYISYKWRERQRFFRRLRMARINVDELYRLMDVGAIPIVIDVRTPTARALEPRRIPGALHVPLAAVDAHVKDLPRDRDIVLYCTCPNEVSAAEAAKLLMNSGFKRVRPLHGGLDAWIAAGYAVESLPGY